MAAISTRLRLGVLASVVALALLAGAADQSAGAGGTIAIPREPLIVAAQTALWLVVATALLVLVLLAYAVATDRSPIVVEPAPRRSWLAYFGALVPVLLVVVLLYLRRPGGKGAFLGPFGLTGPPPRIPAGDANALQGPDTVWLSLLLASLIAAAALTWLFWPARRRQSPPRASPIPQPANEPIVEAVDESIDALRAIPDPRRAIIAAYSSMEASLTRAGVPRRRSDTPLEFLSRALAAVLGISTDAGRLTFLFEFARFSPHDVDESMRSDALVALQSIRARLTTAAPA